MNLLLLVYLLFDLAGIVVKFTNKNKNDLHLNESVIPVREVRNHNPDIYLLVFDEYEASGSLKRRLNFDNKLDTFLDSKGFSIQSGSRSNYYITPLSMASILNMSYVEGIRDLEAVSIQDYNAAAAYIADARVFTFLKNRGYQVVNCSIFDLKGHPSEISESFFPVKAKLISERTLTARMFRDLGWHLYKHFPVLAKMHLRGYINDNTKFYQRVIASASIKGAAPRFIYAHFLMPHEPYFFEKNGKRKPDHIVFQEMKRKPASSYLEYVQYVNTRIVNMIESIQHNNPSAVIVIMGDHGHRGGQPDRSVPVHFFNNLNAVYIPGSNYSHLYDTISGVNQFRMIFNDIFDEQIPRLKDTVVYHKDRKK